VSKDLELVQFPCGKVSICLYYWSNNEQHKAAIKSLYLNNNEFSKLNLEFY